MDRRGVAERAASPTKARFDIDAVRLLVGETVFARGARYHSSGKVEILAADERRVMARVSGTEDYRTEIFGRNASLRVACTCPAFEDFGPCKHVVATALAVNDARTDGPDAFTRIRAYLERQSAAKLAALILERAEWDQALFRKLELSAASSGRNGAIQLRQALDRALRVSGYLAYEEVAGWTTAVDDVLDAVAGAVSDMPPGAAIELAERAIDGIEEAIERIDHSDGHCVALLIKARDIHLAAVMIAKLDPLHLASDLFRREMAGMFDTFFGAVQIYQDALGAAGLAEYRRLASEAWSKIPARTAAARVAPGHDDTRFKLFSILDFFADQDDDVEARIALRRADLSSPIAYVQLVEFCRSHGRRDEAWRHAEEGLWLFEDGEPNERLVCLAADLLLELRRQDDAVSILHKAFEKVPSFKLYERLSKLGGEGTIERLIAALERSPSTKAAIRQPARDDLLVQILTSEKRFDAAWAGVHRNGVSTATKEALAAASLATHPAEAAKIYVARVDALVEQGDNRSYANAAALVARLSDLQNSKEHGAYVASLKTRFGRKRNFMKLLT